MRNYRTFEEAREYIRSQNLKTRREWDRFRKSGKLPDDIPKNPGRVYKNEWKSLDDWLGIKLQEMKFRPFEEAREVVRNLKLTNEEEWYRYCESGKLPDDIPHNPRKTYKKEWRGMGDWLGTHVIAHQKREFRSYDEAKEIVHKLELESQPEWYRYCKSGQKPEDIPSHPDRTYRNKGWPSRNGWGDWLGSGSVSTQNKGWSIFRVKELLKDLIESGIIYSFPDARLYALLNSRGFLNLPSNNRHKQFFENFIEARNTVKGRNAIEEYVRSNSKNPPELSKYIEQELNYATTKDSGILNGFEPVKGCDQVRSPKQIMKEAESMDSICVDPENIQFQVVCSVQDLWNSAFTNELHTVNEVKAKGSTGSEFHDLMNRTFLFEYNAVRQISKNMPKGFEFPYVPSLMQLFVSYKIKTNSCFANFSRTGSGKTLSAILASRLIDSKMTIIVCPNDVVDQWKEAIIKAFPDSVVTKGKTAFNVIRDERRHQYLVLNYDKFSQDYSDNLILNLVQQQIDFLVLDEVHFAKKRDEVDESQRHRRIKGLRMHIRNNNKNVKVLAMSATPVINDLTEGKSLLEILTGTEYHDVETRPTIPNAVNIYQKFMLLSVREKRQYSNVKTNFLEVEASKPTAAKIGQLIRSPLLIENLLTEARIPEIIKHIDPSGQTMIYTEYVTGIIPKLETAVKSAGYSYALYTGEMKDLKPFKEGKVQVLIASRPVSVGVDELQHGCNRLIFNTLPYTNALYEQVIGRVDRNGQDKDVDIFVILGSIDGLPYDKEIKWKIIQDKRTLTDCVVDGTLPRKDSATTNALKQRAVTATREWLQRLEEGHISIVNRSSLKVELIPSGTQQLSLFSDFERQRQIHISEFSRLNNIFNNSRSETIHHKIQQDPQFLVDYLKKQDELRSQWDFDPLDIIASKIRGLEIPARIITRYVIGDFGCGRARLAELLKENEMYSFDHHKILNDRIIPCDMKSVPLHNRQLDIAVFCLSLMEENWPEYIVEVKRCLTQHGLLFIAETTKSLSGRLQRLKEILKEQGFEKYSDEEKGDFTFIEARRP